MFVFPCTSADVEKVILSMANKRCGIDYILVNTYKILTENRIGVIAYEIHFLSVQGTLTDRFN